MTFVRKSSSASPLQPLFCFSFFHSPTLWIRAAWFVHHRQAMNVPFCTLFIIRLIATLHSKSIDTMICTIFDSLDFCFSIRQPATSKHTVIGVFAECAQINSDSQPFETCSWIHSSRVILFFCLSARDSMSKCLEFDVAIVSLLFGGDLKTIRFKFVCVFYLPSKHCQWQVRTTRIWIGACFGQVWVIMEQLLYVSRINLSHYSAIKTIACLTLRGGNVKLKVIGKFRFHRVCVCVGFALFFFHLFASQLSCYLWYIFVSSSHSVWFESQYARTRCTFVCSVEA